MRSIISIHDVSPANLSRVLNIIERMPTNCHKDLALLVIPGLDWQAAQIDELKQLQKQGMILAGHGWKHRCDNITRPYHKLHSLLVSRDVAEHLALDAEQILQLLNDNHQWFSEHDLGAPDLYVPPAWAMGSISKKQLQKSPFRFFETSRGLFDATKQRYCLLPLVGFEADTALRKLILRAWNRSNILMHSQKRPLRISIHPQDPELLLGKSLWALLDNVSEACHYNFFSTR